MYDISIHSPREGRDYNTDGMGTKKLISIHSPREGRDRKFCREYFIAIFQSTRPARGETKLHPHEHAGAAISIHSPREGRDAAGRGGAKAEELFQSTRPARGETWYSAAQMLRRDNFNPLAPRGARPFRRSAARPAGCDFNPLAPRGARPCRWHPSPMGIKFQSTCPARGETSRRRRES